MNQDCIFCRIAAGEIPAELVLEQDDLVAFRDINPQAPVHILVIPRAHVQNVAALEEDHGELVGEMILAAARVARQEGLEESGYRLVFNVGRHGGESVPHLHLHILGGRQMSWPPG